MSGCSQKRRADTTSLFKPVRRRSRLRSQQETNYSRPKRQTIKAQLLPSRCLKCHRRGAIPTNYCVLCQEYLAKAHATVSARRFFFQARTRAPAALTVSFSKRKIRLKRFQ